MYNFRTPAHLNPTTSDTSSDGSESPRSVADPVMRQVRRRNSLRANRTTRDRGSCMGCQQGMHEREKQHISSRNRALCVVCTLAYVALGLKVVAASPLAYMHSSKALTKETGLRRRTGSMLVAKRQCTEIETRCSKHAHIASTYMHGYVQSSWAKPTFGVYQGRTAWF